MRTIAKAKTTTTIATLKMLQLVALTLLATLLAIPSSSDALPITSKPIEGTVENLAWQAWLMLPPEQKQLEKSRKVTPKSIFSLPNSGCPPNHHTYKSECIPTTNINQGELLTQQLLSFITGNRDSDTSGAGEQIEIDYDYKELSQNEDQGVDAADETQGNNDARDVGAVSQSPPNKDEPLKLNLFEQHFPTSDYEVDSAGIEGSGGAAKPPLMLEQGLLLHNIFNATQFLSAIQGMLPRQSNATYNSASDKRNSTLSDLQSEGSNISAMLWPHTVDNNFTISNIEAIALPAVDAGSTVATVTFAEPGPQRVSLFKDDSVVQLGTTVIAERDETDTLATATTTATSMQQQPYGLLQLIRAEAMFPANSYIASATTTTDATAENVQSTVVTSPGTATTTASLRPFARDTEGESTNMDFLLGATASDITTISSAAAKLEATTQPSPAERPRSVVSRNVDADAGEAQELHFSTTEEPEGTTNIQIDDTTVIETRRPTRFSLLAEMQQPSEVGGTGQHETQHVVLKKSKVEPVGATSNSAPLLLVTDTAKTATETTENAAPTATPLPSVKLPARPAMDDRFGVDAADVPPSLPLTVGAALEMPTPTTTTTTASDVDRSGSNLMSTQHDSNTSVSNNNNNAEHKASVMAASEMNVKQELRMINELVKVQRQLSKSTDAATDADATSEITETTAAGTTKKSTTTTTIPVDSETPATATTNAKAIKPAAVTATTAKRATAASALSEIGKATVATTIKNAPATTTTAATTTTIKALLKSSSHQYAGATASASATATATATTTTTTTTPAITTTVAAQTEPSSTIWSKIMPILGFGSAAAATTTTTIESQKDAATTTPTSYTPDSSPSISRSSNRSDRNSKLIRMNHLDANNVSESTTGSSSSSSSTSTATTMKPSITTSAKAIDPEESEFGNLFWWIPMGWRLDSQNEDDANSLLRTPPAVLEEQTKVSR